MPLILKFIFLLVFSIVLFQQPVMGKITISDLNNSILLEIYKDIESLKTEFLELDSISTSSYKIDENHGIISYKKNGSIINPGDSSEKVFKENSLDLKIQISSKLEGGWLDPKETEFEKVFILNLGVACKIYALVRTRNPVLRERLISIIKKHEPPPRSLKKRIFDFFYLNAPKPLLKFF